MALPIVALPLLLLGPQGEGSVSPPPPPALLGDAFGCAIDGGVDVDGDGVSDWLVTDPEHAPRPGRRGSLWIHSGASGAVLHQLEGPDERPFGVAACLLPGGQDHGPRVAALVRPLDPEAALELLELDLSGAERRRRVAVPGVDPARAVRLLRDSESAGSGLMLEHRGRSMGVLLLQPGGQGWTDPAIGVEPRTGSCQARVCEDADGDGFRDVLVWNEDRAGLVELVSSATTRSLGVLRLPPDVHLDSAEIALAGDLDGDGRRDLFVGRRQAGVVQGEETSAVSGASGERLWRVLQTSPGERRRDRERGHASREERLLPGGSPVLALGDVDGDGVRDLVAGCPSRRELRQYSGASGAVLRTLESPTHGFGARIAGPFESDATVLASNHALEADFDTLPTPGEVSVVDLAEFTLRRTLAADG